jgi:hypothetical protein
MEVIYTSNFQPDVVFAGMRFGEPVIALTGLGVALTCLWCYQYLKKTAPSYAVQLGKVFFALTGLSCLLGSLIGHAFLYALPFAWKMPGWTLGMIGVSAMQQVSILRYQELRGPLKGRWLSGANTVMVIGGLWFLSSTLWFPIVEIHAALGFIGMVLPLELYRWRQMPGAGSPQILLGVAYLVGAVMFHVSKVSIGTWFSFFDIAHVFMCFAMYSFAQGIAKGSKNLVIS